MHGCRKALLFWKCSECRNVHCVTVRLTLGVVLTVKASSKLVTIIAVSITVTSGSGATLTEQESGWGDALVARGTILTWHAFNDGKIVYINGDVGMVNILSAGLFDCKGTGWQSKDCQLDFHCQRGISLVWVFNKPLIHFQCVRA